MTDLARPAEHPELSIDQQLALRTAATNLTREFGRIYGTETIERFLLTSYDQFATASSVPHFLPLLAERFARRRLQALARVEGHQQDGKPAVVSQRRRTPACLDHRLPPRRLRHRVVPGTKVLIATERKSAKPSETTP